MENCLQYDAIHGFSVWLRTSSNPADINRFSKPYLLEKELLKPDIKAPATLLFQEPFSNHPNSTEII